MTPDDLIKIKPGEKITCTAPFRYFTVGESYTVRDFHPFGKTVRNNRGVDKIIVWELMGYFETEAAG